MTWLLNLRTGVKLQWLFGGGLILVVAVVVYCLSRLAAVDAIAGNIATGPLSKVESLDRISATVQAFRSTQVQLVLGTGGNPSDRLADAEGKYEPEVQSLEAKYGSLAASGADRDRFSNLCSDWADYEAMSNQLATLCQGNRQAATTFLMGRLRSRYSAVGQDISSLISINEDQAASLVAPVHTVYRTTLVTMVVLLVAILAIGSLVCRSIVIHVSSSIRDVSTRLESLRSLCITNLQEALRAMECGDLTAEIATGTQPIAVRTIAARSEQRISSRTHFSQGRTCAAARAVLGWESVAGSLAPRAGRGSCRLRLRRRRGTMPAGRRMRAGRSAAGWPRLE